MNDLELFVNAASCMAKAHKVIPMLKMMEGSKDRTFSELRNGLNEITDAANGIERRLVTINTLYSGFNGHERSPEEQKEAAQWKSEKTHAAFAGARNLEKKDIRTIVDAIEQSGSSEWPYERAIPIIQNNSANSSFVLAFIKAIFDAATTHPAKTISVHTAEDFFNGIAHSVVEDFTMPQVPPPRTWSNLPDIYMGGIRDDTPPGLVLDDLMFFHKKLLEGGQRYELQILLDRFSKESRQVATDYFVDTIMPYLKQVALSSQDDSTTRPEKYSNFFIEVLKQYLIRYVGEKPQEPETWSEAPRGCQAADCTDCKELDQFLAHPTQRTKQFKRPEGKRKHLLYRLDCYMYSFERSSDGDYVLKVDRGRKPFTLSITKTRKAWDRTLQQWRSRIEPVRCRIKEIGMPPTAREKVLQFLSMLHAGSRLIDIENSMPDDTQPEDGNTNRETGRAPKRKFDGDENTAPGKRPEPEVIDLSVTP